MAEYFVDKVIFEVADLIKEAVNIGKLNDHCRKLAMLGMELQGKPKIMCYGCKKEIGSNKNLKCHFCK